MQQEAVIPNSERLEEFVALKEQGKTDEVKDVDQTFAAGKNEKSVATDGTQPETANVGSSMLVKRKAGDQQEVSVGSAAKKRKRHDRGTTVS